MSRGLALAVALAATACPGDDGSGDPTGTTSQLPGTGTTTGGGTAEDTATPGSTTTTPDPDSGTTTSPPDPTTTGPGNDTDEPTTGGPMGACGNGVPDPGEDCDDGNGVESDGCNNDCTASGSIVWYHSQGARVGQDEEAFDVAVDAMGRAYVVGEFYGTARDFWVRQYTEEDGLGWTQSVDGAGSNDGARGAEIDGGTLYVAGYRNQPGQNNNMWIRSYDLDGNVGLNITYNDPYSGSDVLHGVAVDPGGNFVVAGNEVGYLQGNNVSVREYTAAGGLAWSAGYASGGSGNDQARAVATDAAGNVAVVGFHTAGNLDMWIRYYDTNGAAQWTVTYANANGLDDQAQAVAFDSLGNVVVAGFEVDPVIPWRLWLTKYDPLGGELWSMTWDGETLEGANALGVAIDDADDIVVVGQQRIGGFDEFLVQKRSPDGVVRWTTSIAGYAGTNAVGRGVAIGPDQRIWVAGGIDQGVDGRDVYVARISP